MLTKNTMSRVILYSVAGSIAEVSERFTLSPDEEYRSDLISLESAVRSLWEEIAWSDMLARSRASGGLELLVRRYQNLRIKIDGNLNHARPHVHVDCGKDWHAASYAIDDATRLAGRINNQYDRLVRQFIDKNRKLLLRIFNGVRLGENVEALVELAGNDLG